MLHNECHLESGTVGRIHLFPNFSLVEVAEGEAAHAIEQASRAQLRGQTFRLDYDRGRPEGGRPEGGGGEGGAPRGNYGGGGGGYGGGGGGGGKRSGGGGYGGGGGGYGGGGGRSRDDRPRGGGGYGGGGGGKPSNRDSYDRGRRDR
jgi:hypothetical protein